jgi:hypothetical protein
MGVIQDKNAANDKPKRKRFLAMKYQVFARRSNDSETSKLRRYPEQQTTAFQIAVRHSALPPNRNSASAMSIQNKCLAVVMMFLCPSNAFAGSLEKVFP